MISPMNRPYHDGRDPDSAAALFHPQAFALYFEQVGRITVGQRFAILGEFIGHLAILGRNTTGKGSQNGSPNQRFHQTSNH